MDISILTNKSVFGKQFQEKNNFIGFSANLGGGAFSILRERKNMGRPKLYNTMLGVRVTPKTDNRLREVAKLSGWGIGELLRVSLTLLWGSNGEKEEAARRLRDIGAELPRAETA